MENNGGNMIVVRTNNNVTNAPNKRHWILYLASWEWVFPAIEKILNLNLTREQEDIIAPIMPYIAECYKLINSWKSIANSWGYAVFSFWCIIPENQEIRDCYLKDIYLELRKRYLLEKIWNYFEKKNFYDGSNLKIYVKEFKETFPNDVDSFRDTLMEYYPTYIKTINLLFPISNSDS
jgi:hypothetical protein